MPKVEKAKVCDMCGTTDIGDFATIWWYKVDKTVKIVMCEKCMNQLCEAAKRNRQIRQAYAEKNGGDNA